MTPAVITLVWNRPGVARGPRRIGRGVVDESELIGAADVEVVADDLLEEDPTEIGVSSIWVRENSAYRIDRSWRWPAARSAAVNGCGESGQPLERQRIDIRWPNRSQIACTAAATGSSGSARGRTVTGYAFGGARKIRIDRMGGNARAGISKPVCRPSAATIPTSGSTPSRRSPKPPESPPWIRCDSQRYVARYCRRYLARCGSARCR